MSIKTSKKVLTVTEAIESRRSIRSFQKKSISNKVIEDILNLVRLTPSACRKIDPFYAGANHLSQCTGLNVACKRQL